MKLRIVLILLACVAFSPCSDALSLHLSSSKGDNDLPDDTSSGDETVGGETDDPAVVRDTKKVVRTVKTETKKKVKKVKDEAEDSYWRFRKVDLYKMVVTDSNRIYANFMPDFVYRPRAVRSLGWICILSILWFVVFFDYLYTSDRTYKLEAGTSSRDAVSVREHYAQDQPTPDLVIVLHHPDHDYSDKHTEISAAQMEVCMKCADDLPNFKAAIESATAIEKSISVGQAVEASMPTMHTLRVALLKDLYGGFPQWGLDRKLWSSIDGDEFFLAATLHRDTVGSYLARQGVDLQLNTDAVAKLGVNQPPEETASSPPYIRYEPKLCERLNNSGVMKLSQEIDFYKPYYGRDRNGSIASSRIRVHMICRELNSKINLDLMKSLGLIVDWYPAQSPTWLAQLEEHWANWHLLYNFTFAQPVIALREYFDSRVAFNFAWTGHYSKCLLALVPVGIAIEIGAKVASAYMDPEKVASRVVMSSGLVIIVWAKTAWNVWVREERYFMKLWNLDPDQPDTAVRPDFIGHMQPSVADLSLEELHTSQPWKDKFLRGFATGLTLFFCVAVQVWVIVWIDIFEGQMDLTASLALTIQIKVFEFLFNAVVPRLVDMENHKHQSDYYNSYLWKNFLFQAVNSYSAFFYMAVKQRYTRRGCPEGGCVEALHKQLTITQLILSVSAVVEILIASVIVRLRIYFEDSAYKKAHDGEEPPPRSFAEEQSKHADYRLQQQINQMTALMLSLGFILIFGSTAPRMVPFCLLVFAVRLRVCALMLVKYSKRPVPRQQFGIGVWSAILKGLMSIGIAMSGFITVTFATMFEDTPVVTRLAGFILYLLLVAILWTIIDFAKPIDDQDVLTLVARRDRVQAVLAKALDRASQILESKSKGSPLQKAKSTVGKDKAGHELTVHELLKENRFSEIPALHETTELSKPS